MVAAGVLEGVDFFLCPHVGVDGKATGEVIPGLTGFLATSKLDIWFEGREAHVGLAPQEGRSALLGAAQAVLGLHALPRHSAANSRVNVGVMRAGTIRNVIPARAYLQAEVRSEETAVVEFLEQQAYQVVAGAAAMWGLGHRIERVGGAPSAASDLALVERVARLAASLPTVRRVREPVRTGGSEDATFMMRRVQEQGGQATYVIVGTDLASGHHTPRFDLDERSMLVGIQLFSLAALELTGSLEEVG
jgi:aminobenzoyl-glutamate utilization protein A